uniref:Pr1-like protein n=1 Tax=Oryza sativa subsp. japonica TaxID=39947 RepID=Q6YW72_ORYSJ|nr:pr1-like protein [Oryza sativa Japonica Group]BAD05817.1 pr1-like protein [Oryza sativa Japonica Group]
MANRGEGRADRVHGGGAHAAAPRSTVDRAHPGSHRPAPWVPRVSRTRGRGRLTAGPHAAAARCARRRPRRRSGGRRRARAPMVTGGGHRHGGAAAERGEGKGEKKRRSTAHPGSTATTETATGAEEGGGAARVDGVDGAPAVGERNGGVDEVAGDAVKPKVATPRREVVRGDDGGGPELGGDGGERERRRELDSDGERGRRVAETVEGGTGKAAGFAAAAALGHGRGGGSGGRKGMTGGPHPSARVAGGPARQRHARGEKAEWAAGERRERERDGPSRPKRGRRGKSTF